MCIRTVSWDSLRIPGVLQRLGFTYLVVAGLDAVVAQERLINLSSVSGLIPLHTYARTWIFTVIAYCNYFLWKYPVLCSQETRWYSLHDVLLYWPAWFFVIALEILWLCLTFFLPVPGCPTLVKSCSWSYFILVLNVIFCFNGLKGMVWQPLFKLTFFLP